MAWEQLGTSWPHVGYATTAFALLLFGAISGFVKERLYIGEASVATVYGLIVGPHCLDWFSPTKWGNTDYITLELSRIVLVVQIFAVAVELPKKYMLKHWLSVFYLLIPTMAFGWLIGSVFIWQLVPTLRWIEALAIAGCVTATDPVLASAVVGKGKFARRVPGHLRNVLSAESASNDGMAFPFTFLAVNILLHEHHPRDIAKDFIVISVLYECVFACVLGAVIGYSGRHLIKFAEKHKLIDRESFLAYYFALAIFCAGVGTVIGVDDLLVAFAAGTAFAWDGWFAKKTEKSDVSNVIDLLINTAYFIYFGAIIPWEKFNDAALGIKAWKLVILAIVMFIGRRIPIILALKPLIPDIKTWREAMFCGHFGPIGVGGLFMALVARAELESGTDVPATQADLPKVGDPHYYIIQTMWPITCFLVLGSIIVHGSSIAVFTLGKRINNITITMSYTTGGNGPSWLSRLPERMKTDMSGNHNILRLEKIDTEVPSAKTSGKKRTKSTTNRFQRGKSKRGENEVPVSLSLDLKENNKIERVTQVGAIDRDKLQGYDPKSLHGYQEGSHVLFEDDNGNVVKDFDIGHENAKVTGNPRLEISLPEDEQLTGDSSPTVEGDASATPTDVSSDAEGRKIERTSSQNVSDAASGISSTPTAAPIHLPQRGEQVFAYQLDDNIVVENCDGEIIRRYKIHRRGEGPENGTVMQRLGNFFGIGKRNKNIFPTQRTQLDVEHSPEDNIERETDDDVDEPELSPGEDRAIQDHLETMLENGEFSENAENSIREEVKEGMEHLGTDFRAAGHKISEDVSQAEHDVWNRVHRFKAQPRGSRKHTEGQEESDSVVEFTQDDYDQIHGPGRERPGQSSSNLGRTTSRPRRDTDSSDEGDSDDDIPFQGSAEGEEEETAVERKRRLAALGVSEDTDDSPIRRHSTARRHDDDDEDDVEEEPRIKFHLPGKK